MPATRAPGSAALVIVESPAKARTIGAILGDGYVVKACLGHVRDLPPRALGIDVDDGFRPAWRPIKGREKVLAALRKAARAATAVYLAPDPDREGEAIAWHLAEALELPADRTRRVTFHELTRRGVLEAFRRPAALSMDRVHAQQARRVLDRLVGWSLSPLLSKNVCRGLSAGRVQSVALRLVVERERELRGFRPEEHWTLLATLAPDVRAELEAVDGLPLGLASASTPGRPLFALPDEKAATALADELRGAAFEVVSAEAVERAEPPFPPFTTSLLQQQAWARLKFSAARTMRVAQQLYEGVRTGAEGAVGLITYMRTDSYRVAGEALAEVRAYIGRAYGDRYVPASPVVRGRRKGAQDAHEAIRPTDVNRTPEALRPRLTRDQFELYRLVWTRFVASQMAPARVRAAEARIRGGRALFVARGRELLFDGYRAAAGPDAREDGPALPPLHAGDRPALRELRPRRQVTEPPSRFTEASLVRALEKHGIGRPSTYAPILGALQERRYAEEVDRHLRPTALGELVVEKLVAHFDGLLDTGFTAKMEAQLDGVEAGREDWTRMLQAFYEGFRGDLEKARAGMTSEKGRPAGGAACANCGKPMVVRWGKRGRFLGCSGFPACAGTAPPPGEAAKEGACDRCGSPMTERRGRRGKFLACTRYPSCKRTRPAPRGNRRYEVPAGWKEDCDKCGRPFTIRWGRRGGFILCTDYPRCKNSRRFPRDWDRSLKAVE